MKIVVVHGEDNLNSRERFVQITKGVKSKGWEVVYLNPKTDFESQLTNKSLFEDQNLYVIEELKNLPDKKITWLNLNSDKFDSQLLIYSKKAIPVNILKKISKDIKSEKFEISKLIFKFTDSLYPGNSENALSIYRKIRQQNEPRELLVALMAKNFRDMLWIQIGSAGLSYPDWRMKKLSAMSNKFARRELEDIINQLADIDYKSKTSDLNVDLILEMLIVEKFN